MNIQFPNRVWQIVSSGVLVDRRPWLSLSEHNLVLPNIKRTEGYLLCETREYALTVALMEDARVPPVRQYKHRIRSLSYDLPGGYLNVNEEPLTAAKRELLEETGWEAER